MNYVVAPPLMRTKQFESQAAADAIESLILRRVFPISRGGVLYFGYVKPG